MQENTTRTPKLKLLKQPLTAFFDRVSHPAKLSLTLNRLIFDSLLRRDTFLPDELENLHALLDLLVFCQALAPTSTFAEA
jgi:hypothetical protein